MKNLKTRRDFVRNIAAGSSLLLFTPAGVNPTKILSEEKISDSPDPTICDYSPCGEYIKDHSFVFHDGWYHLFSISGIQGFYHGYNGNEETISWSISKDLVHWEFRGHVIHATQRSGAFDQHEIWAPFCFKDESGFYMFYTGVIHPSRPMEYRKLGHDHPWIPQGHKETQGLAVSKDLTYWDKISDFNNGLGIPGRDSFVTSDVENNRYLLYSTIGSMQAHVAESVNLIDWKPIGICAEFPEVIVTNNLGRTTEDLRMGHFQSAESLTVRKHPLTGQWIMLGNWQYIISDDPLRFDGSKAREYNRSYKGNPVDMGFACEIIQLNGKWYRSGTMGKRDYWRLGFTEIEWEKEGAFKVIKPSKIAMQNI